MLPNSTLFSAIIKPGIIVGEKKASIDTNQYSLYYWQKAVFAGKITPNPMIF
ncbi:hypothetical protein [Candidatus Methylomicrobium oryzae]|jgi:hypothetical protein|uniref:hypothetical protein n=1 Tax=Candidatus Methylomicrobium oryzae TaxID=2802053 RepID=UPI001922216E|nr:hypothetical protein [Methylomicrobium sp. RS1]